MSIYSLNKNGVKKLEAYEYSKKGRSEATLQALIAENPEIILDLPGLELTNSEICLVCREYNTSRGAIDILMITDQGEIIIIETKLFKNPESTRTVVAQSIDYVKAFCSETVDTILDKLSGKRPIKDSFTDKAQKDERFINLLTQNIDKGNFKVIILGDFINPNILGMVESIQAAPHLAFTIYLVELNSAIYSEDEIIVSPKIVANTLEVERSVISIEFSKGTDKPIIDSQIPLKDGKGSKPKLSWQQYIEGLSDKTVAQVIDDFKQKWVREVDNSISMGQSGFSLGINNYDGNKRKAIQFIYGHWVDVISEKFRRSNDIPDKIYNEYKEEFKKIPRLYDKYIIGNKVVVEFEDITTEELNIILNAGLKLAKRIKETQ